MKSLAQLVAAQQRKLKRSEDHFKLKEGTTTLRILPSWREDDETFWHPWALHYVKAPNGEEIEAVHVCNRRVFDEDCPICDALQGLKGSVDEEYIKNIRGSTRYLVNALVNGSSDPVIVELPTSVVTSIFDMFEEYPNMVNLDEGTDLKVKASGTGLNRSYSVMPSSKSNPVDHEVMRNIENLDEHVQQQDEGKMRTAVAVLTGLSAEATVVGGVIEHDDEEDQKFLESLED